jgi:CHAT domain-containing protein/tetratricopeptide (TPR) repeat protein
MSLRRASLWVVALLVTFSSIVLFSRSGVGKEIEELDTAIAGTLSSAESYEKTPEKKWKLLLDEATRLYRKRDFKGALAPAEEALSEARATNGAVHSSVAQTMHRLASIHHELGRADAESLYVETLGLWRALPDSQRTGMPMTLGNLGELYRYKRRYADAERCLLEALNLKRQQLPDDDPSIAVTLGALGSLYDDLGDYSKAIDYNQASLDIRRNCDPPDPLRLISSLINVTSLYSNLGMLEEAVACSEEALAVAKREQAAVYQAWAMANLSYLHLEVDPEESIALAMRGLATLESSGESDLLIQHDLLSDLAIAYRNEDLPKKALLYHRKCDSLVVVALGEGLGRDRLASLRNIAEDCRLLGKYAVADSFFTLVLQQHEEVEGEWHPLVGEALGGIVALCHDVGDNDRGLRASKRMYQVWDRDLTAALPVLDLREAFTKANSRRQAASWYFSFFLNVREPSPALVGDAVDVAMGAKGRVADEILYRQRAMEAADDPEAEALIESLRAMKLELSDLYVSDLKDDDRTSHDARIASLEADIKASEMDLAKINGHLSGQWSAARVRSGEVASRLPANSALVEYVKIMILDERSDTDSWVSHYLAVVLDGEGGASIVDLGRADELDRLVEDYRGHMLRCASQPHVPSSDDKVEYKELAGRIYDLAVAPFGDKIADRKTLIVAPDGALNLVSFSGLLDDDGDYLVEKHRLHYVSAGRDLLRPRYAGKTGVGLFALGDPDFDAGIEDRLAVSEGSPPATADAGRALTRSVLSDCESLWPGPLGRLPYSRREIDLIVGEWESNGEAPVDFFTGPEASEDNFKSLAPGHRVIHLSTHGYYDDGSCASQRGMGAEGRIDNPLLLSGLYFSGANLRGVGMEEAGCEDAVLTAYEVSAMNLDGTEVVVLAACETGLGEVMVGEGVFGLRRAFLVAGAQTVVCALWPVSDESTAQMMGRFHSASDKSIPERVRDAQLAEIKRLRKAGLSDHPYNWAGFIAIGGWR